MTEGHTSRQTALLIIDLQNDFLHPDGAYGRAGQTSKDIALLPQRIAPLAQSLRAAGGWVLSTNFTLVPGRDGEPLVSKHLQERRPFLAKGDFLPGSWGHQLVDDLAPADFAIEKIAYSAFYMSRLEWVLRRCDIRHLVVAGIVTNGGVTSTVRDAHVRDFDVTVLSDGCAAFSPAEHETALSALRSVAHVTTIASVRAGHEAHQ
jgi:nicotinamidase-related amidase